MNRIAALSLSVTLVLAATTCTAQSRVDTDADAAQALAKRNDCFKCHAIDKFKKGPPFKRIAARLKTKTDGVESIVEHITSGRLIQLEDGTDEKHKIIDTKDPAELRNIAQWILSL